MRLERVNWLSRRGGACRDTFLTKCVAMHRTTTPSAWPTMDERLANRKRKGYGKLSRHWRTSCSGKTSSTTRAALSALASASPSLVHPCTHRPFAVPNRWDTSRGVCDGKGITNAAGAGMRRSGQLKANRCSACGKQQTKARPVRGFCKRASIPLIA